jgi:DNA-directed RNA polymerase specialized sigma24 family protein
LERVSAEPRPVSPAPEAPDDALWAAVAALPARTRHIVALRYVLDMPEVEIARVLGLKRGTVASTLSRARRQLSAALGHSHGNASLAPVSPYVEDQP